MNRPAVSAPPPAAESEPAGIGLRCPNCGMTFTTTHPSYPRCPRCTRFVVTCRNCNWFDKNFFECTNPVILRGAANLSENQGSVRIQDPDVYTSCPQHDSKLHVTLRTGPPLWARAVTVLSFSSAGALTLLLVLSLWARVPKPNAPPRMSLNLRYENEVEAQTPFVIECFIQNLEAHESPPIWLRFQQGLFDRLDLMEIQPPALDMVVRGGAMSSQGRYFKFPPVPGNSETVIRFQLRGREIEHIRSLVLLEVPGATQGQRYLDLDVN